MLKHLDDIKSSLNNTQLFGIELLAKGYNKKLFAISGSIALKCYHLLNREIGDLDIEVKTEAHYDEVCNLMKNNGFKIQKNSYSPTTHNHSLFKMPFSETTICIFTERYSGFPWKDINTKHGLLKLSNPTAICLNKLEMLKHGIDIFDNVKTKDSSKLSKHINDVIFYNESQMIKDNNLQIDIANEIGMGRCDKLGIATKVMHYRKNQMKTTPIGYDVKLEERKSKGVFDFFNSLAN